MATEPAAVDGDGYGFELPLLLLAGFRDLIDRLHEELARRGHGDLRPAHGFALQAVAAGHRAAGELSGSTVSDIGRRLGVSKQAAGKTVDRLIGLGYVERASDPRDARRALVLLTARGHDALRQSAAVFDDLRAAWAGVLGADRLRDVEAALRAVTPRPGLRLDVPGWFGG